MRSDGSVIAVVLRIREAGVLAFLVILGVAFSLLTDTFSTVQNLTTVATSAAILSIAACAQGIVLLTRNLDVSVGSIMGFAAYLTADFAANHPTVTPLAIVLLPLAIGAALGLANGLLVAYGKVPALIATLGTMSLYRGFTYIYAHGQEVTSSRLPRWMLTSVDARFHGVPLLVVVAALIVAAVAVFLQYFPLGRRIYAVGSNPLASFFFGLRAERVVLLAYVLAGLLSGAAGLLYAARVGTVTVVLASGWELSSLASAVIGGISVSGGSGTVAGAAFGAVVLATIDNGLVLLAVSEFWRMFIQGVAIVAAMAVDVLIAASIAKAVTARRSARRRR
jgi:rhamnose transport system permease protein